VAPGQGQQRPRGPGGGQGPVPADPRGVPGALGLQAPRALRRRDVRRPGGGRGRFPRLPPGDGLAHGHRGEGRARVQPGRAPDHARRHDTELRLASTSAYLRHHGAARIFLTRRRRGVLQQDGFLQVIHPVLIREHGREARSCCGVVRIPASS
jgi:hypothetical protein